MHTLVVFFEHSTNPDDLAAEIRARHPGAIIERSKYHIGMLWATTTLHQIEVWMLPGVKNCMMSIEQPVVVPNDSNVVAKYECLQGMFRDMAGLKLALSADKYGHGIFEVSNPAKGPLFSASTIKELDDYFENLDRCADCCKTNVVVKKEIEKVPYRLNGGDGTDYYVDVVVPIHTCLDCNLSWTDYVAEELIDKAVEEARKKHV